MPVFILGERLAVELAIAERPRRVRAGGDEGVIADLVRGVERGVGVGDVDPGAGLLAEVVVEQFDEQERLPSG